MTKIENIKSKVAKLSLKEQILELLMLDIRYFTAEDNSVYPITKLPKEIQDVLEEYPIGGVILFRENLTDIDQIVRLTDDLQNNIPSGRLIAIDQEGGSVTRIYNATEMPGNMALGAIDDVLVTSKSSQILAVELESLGFNFMFAPVLDVNSNPQNPIVGVRSFGKNPELVARHGVAYCDGLNRVGLIACGKHFPGHGDTDSDSHHALPVINKSIDEFTNVDLFPFSVAIDANIESIMTAHIVFPNLDNSTIMSSKTNREMPIPATLSKKILTELLRNKMHYKGVIVSDALDMHAISDNFTHVEATINCIEAGVDLVLMPFRLWSQTNIKEFKNYIDELVNQCEQSQFLQERIFESCCRILNLKQFKVLPKLHSQEPLEARLAHAKDIVLCEKHQLLQEDIAGKAITLAKNTANVLPWKSALTDKIMLIVANDAVLDDAMNAMRGLGYQNIIVKNINEQLHAEELADIDKAITLTYNLNNESAKPFNHAINILKNLNIPNVILSCHNPYDDLYLDNAETYVLAFGCSGLDQTNYSIRKFELNMLQAINKIMNAKTVAEFNECSNI